MGWTITPEPQPVLLHYSEDPAIAEFVPHVPATNPSVEPAVWAIQASHAPLYWFPRDCPRVTVWAHDDDQRARLHERFDSHAGRLHVITNDWLDALRTTALFEYAFDPAPFAPWPEAEGQWIARTTVRPTAVEPAGDLVARHATAGIELRAVEDLAAIRAAVVESGLPFSIVRVR